VSARLLVSGSNLTGEVPFSAALVVNGAATVLSSPAGERGDLARLCATLCEQHTITPSEIKQVRMDLGPGSYTGLRVAVTFVRFLQAFGPVEVQAVDSLAALALHANEDAEDGLVVRSMLDARRGRYHTAKFSFTGGKLVALEASAATSTEQVLAAIEPGERVVMPQGLAEQLAPRLEDRQADVVVARQLTAQVLLSDRLPWFTATAEELEPRYLMATYAED
jgi:tRNA threonylcarbamoyl adenosine modification protein YeaZ